MLNLALSGLGVAGLLACGAISRGFGPDLPELRGHGVLRVAPGGSTYEVFILNDADQSREVIKRFDPYQAN